MAGQGLYKPALSTTAQIQPGLTFSIGYGDGSGADGLVYRDRVEVAGFVVDNQTVESATTVSSEFTEDPYCWVSSLSTPSRTNPPYDQPIQQRLHWL